MSANHSDFTIIDSFIINSIIIYYFCCSNQKPKRNGIVTNPALRLVANVKNGLDNAAANLRKSTSSANPASKTNSFHWRKETPL